MRDDIVFRKAFQSLWFLDLFKIHHALKEVEYTQSSFRKFGNEHGEETVREWGFEVLRCKIVPVAERINLRVNRLKFQP